MAFIENAKKEIIENKLEKNFAVARLSGFFACGTKAIVKNEDVKAHIKTLLQEFFGIDWDGGFLQEEVFSALQLEIDNLSIQQYLTGFFLAYANGSVKSGYNLHFVYNEKVTHLFAQFDIFCKVTSGIIYIKELESVLNLLTLVGATRAVLELNNIFALREVRKSANRLTNAESANIDRQISASLAIIEKIKALNLEKLDDKLKAVAKARVKHPTLSLEELAKKIGITKSCLNHRLRKILCYN